MFESDPLDGIEYFTFFRDGCATMSRNVCDLLKLAGIPVTPTNIAAIVKSLPLDADWLVGDDWDWRRGYFAHCMEMAYRRNNDHPRCDELEEYFFRYFVSREPLAQYMIIHAFTGILWELPAVPNQSDEPSAWYQHGAVGRVYKVLPAKVREWIDSHTS